MQLRKSRNRKQKKVCESEVTENKIGENNKKFKREGKVGIFLIEDIPLCFNSPQKTNGLLLQKHNSSI